MLLQPGGDVVMSRATPCTPTGLPWCMASRLLISRVNVRPSFAAHFHFIVGAFLAGQFALSHATSAFGRGRSEKLRHVHAEQFALRITGNRLHGLVDGSHVAFEIEREDDVVCVLNQLAITLFTFSKSFFCSLTIDERFAHLCFRSAQLGGGMFSLLPRSTLQVGKKKQEETDEAIRRAR